MSDFEWQEKAACRGVGTDHFFPNDEGEYDNLTALRQICNYCPVLGTCREHAIEHEEAGFWGKMTEKERRSERRKRRKR